MKKSCAEAIGQLRRLLSAHRRILVLGGAGLSTESGLSDFRSRQARDRVEAQFGRPVEAILSAGCFQADPELFFACFRALFSHRAAPNRGHLALAALEGQGRLLSILTQNVDGLHQAAGNRRVLELHGSLREARCPACGRPVFGDWLGSSGIPRCPDCGNILKPDVTLYDEPLNEAVLRAARARMFSADLLLIAGTSLSVAPAAELPQYYMGKELVIINRSPTPLDSLATLRFFEDAGQVLGEAVGIPSSVGKQGETKPPIV